MSRFTVVIHPRFPKDLKAIERAGRKDVVRRILSSLRLLEEDPFQARPGLDIQQLAIAGEGGRSVQCRQNRRGLTAATWLLMSRRSPWCQDSHQPSHPTPSRSESKRWGSGGRTRKFRWGTSMQSRSGGGGGIHTSG